MQRRSFAVFLFTILSFLQTSFAEAADIRATNGFPISGATFYTTDTIVFTGSVENMESNPVSEVGYADIEIDWGSDATIDRSENANPDGSGNMLGSLTSGGQKNLEESISNPPIGNHRYRFFADTLDDLPDETDDENNVSSWVPFTVSAVPVAPTITFSGTPNPVLLGSSASLTWTVTDATSCTGSNGSGGWSGPKNANGGTESVSPTVTTLYTISCTGPGGSATKSFTIDVSVPTPVISLTLSANPVNSGTPVTLTWSATNATLCTASGGWSGTKAAPGNEIVTPLTTTTYTLSCTGAGGTTAVSQTVSVNGSLPGITLTATPTSVGAGSPVTLEWTVTDATSCTGASGWSGSKSVPTGTQIVNPVVPTLYRLTCTGPAGVSTAEVTVSISGSPDLITTLWYITPSVSNKIHTSVASTSAQPLREGQATTFRSLVSNIGSADTPTGFTNRFWYNWGWSGAVVLSGVDSAPLTAQSTTSTYMESSTFTPDRSGTIEIQFCPDYLPNAISESNEGNNCAWRNYNVARAPGSPSTTMMISNGVATSTVNGEIIYMIARHVVGATSTISWHTDNATNCTGSSSPADPVWNGPKNGSSGSVGVSPTATTSYTLTCTGPGGTHVRSARVQIIVALPDVSFTGSSGSIANGTSATLSWNVTSASTCTGTSNPADPAWDGHKNRVSGSLNVSPTATTIYTLSCSSPITTGAPGGTVSKSFTVTVTDPVPVISLSSNRNPMTPIDTARLTWTATQAGTCTGTSNPADPAWDGVRNSAGGSLDVSPDVTTTYTLSCTSPDGLSTIPTSLTLSVASTPPIINFNSNPRVIIEGNTTLLSWIVSGASSCTGTSNPADLAWDNLDWGQPGGYTEEAGYAASPAVPTEYTLSCTGDWGSNEFSREIDVVPEAEITDFRVCVAGPGGECRTANEILEVNPGTPLEVHWDSEDATTCSAISGGAPGYRFSTAGAVSGSDIEVRATTYADSTDTYTIACGSPSLLTSEYVSVTVHTNSVLPAIWIMPKVVRPSGGQITVGWDTNNGDQSVCSIRGGGLTSAVLHAGTETGSSTIPVLGRTTFVITCPTQVVNNNEATAGDTESATTTVELSPRIWGR